MPVRIRAGAAFAVPRRHVALLACSAASALAAGCAAEDRVAAATARAAAGNEVVCAYEAPPGSFVKRHVCRTRLDEQRARERSRSFLEDLRRRR